MISTQYIMDESAKLTRKLKEVRERMRRYFASLLIMISAAIIEGVMPKPIALSVGDPLTVDETKQALRSMANGIGMDRMSCQKNAQAWWAL